MRSFTLLACCAAFLPTRASAQATKADTTDPYLWLEDVHGARAMAWVNAENAKTTAVLEKDPRWEGIYKAALTMAQAKDRLPYVSYIGGELYNFWRDSAHVRGIWRKTSLDELSQRHAQVDHRARSRRARQGRESELGLSWLHMPAARREALPRSPSPMAVKTRAPIREFDLASRSFVKNGFYLPKGKQRVAWTSQDTILVSREWNPGEVTSSGYPYIVKKLARGKPLADAVEIFRGSANDGGYGVSPATLVDAAGHRVQLHRPPHQHVRGRALHR